MHKSGTEAGDEKPTSERAVSELTTTMLKAERLEGIEACFGRHHLQKTAFLQGTEEAEGVRCFLEESPAEQDSGPGRNEVLTC